MKRYGNLWDQVVSWDNLILAARKARRGKRDRVAVQRFEFDLERQLLALGQELKEGTYRPGGFTTHWITRPKGRLISAAPYRDRVVHHALMNVLEPILERHFHPHSFACRKGKGTHAAIKRAQEFSRRYPFVFKFDIEHFFPGVDHALLSAELARLIADPVTLRLCNLILKSGAGIHAHEFEPQLFPGDDPSTGFRQAQPGSSVRRPDPPPAGEGEVLKFGI